LGEIGGIENIPKYGYNIFGFGCGCGKDHGDLKYPPDLLGFGKDHGDL
jgi:hypothetical protein